MKPNSLGLLMLLSSVVWADQAPPVDGQYQTQPIDPVIQQLQSLQNMRLRLEQDWSSYLQSARSNTGSQPIQQGSTPEVRQMRQEVNQNLARMEERFRCLDVDLKGNNGNVVLVCGDNNGGINTNNQQALGADLTVSGGGL